VDYWEEYTEVPRLVREETLECLQMVLPDGVCAPNTETEIVKLSDANADEMVALTTRAFPGFFRQRTCEMGSYYGVRSPSGELIAMGGERLKLMGSRKSVGCAHIRLFEDEGWLQQLFGRWCENIARKA